MSLKVYTTSGNPRASKIQVAAALAQVPVELVTVTYEDIKKPEYLKKNPLGKVPVLETPEGFVFESNTIMRYIARQNRASGLYGQNAFQEAKVDQWLDFAATELEPLLMTLIIPVLGYYPLDPAQGQKAHADLLMRFTVLDELLKTQNFLVGEQVTLADVNLASYVVGFFRFVLGEDGRKRLPNLVRWYVAVSDLPQWREFFGRPRMCQTPFSALQFVPQQGQQQQQQQKKQQPQQQKPKEEKKQQPKQEAAEEEEEKPVKTSNPLDSLPPSTFNLDDWKRRFLASKDWKTDFEWFWQNFDDQGWSCWEVLYEKAEGEGAQLLKTSNTMKGFLQRTDQHFRKYAFAIHGLYGEEPNLEIRGAWMWRGADIPLEMKDHPSFEFHKFNKIDKTNEAQRKLFEDYWMNQTEDESVVNGLRARVLVYFR